MPTSGMMYNDLVREPMQMVVDEVELEGLTKLVATGYSVGITLVSPDSEKTSAEERKREREERRETHKGPHPTEVLMSIVNMAQKLVTKDGESPRIIQTYTN